MVNPLKNNKNNTCHSFVWRSLLYVPANNQRFIDRAHTRGADAIILDLEDSVPATGRDPCLRTRRLRPGKTVPMFWSA